MTKRSSTADMRRLVSALLRRLALDEQGVALVEMTLVTPFLLVLSAGVFEFSSILHSRLLMEAGVEDAARYVARCSDQWDTCVARAKNIAVNGDATDGTARLSGWVTDDITIPAPTLIPAVDDEGNLLYRSSTANVEIVTVTGTYVYTGTGLWSYLGFGALTLSTSHQERIIGW